MYSRRSCACLLRFAPPRGQKTDFFVMLKIYGVVKTHTALVCRTRSGPRYVYEATMYAPLKIMVSGMLHFQARTLCHNYLPQVLRFNVWTEHDDPNFSPSFNIPQPFFECHKNYLYYFGLGFTSVLPRFALYLLRDTCKAGIIKSFTSLQNGTFSRNSTAMCT